MELLIGRITSSSESTLCNIKRTLLKIFSRVIVANEWIIITAYLSYHRRRYVTLSQKRAAKACVRMASI